MAYNRELSQFASLITVDDSTSVVGIDTFVGIGTTSPTSTLTVQGNTLITGITTTGSLSIGSTQVISSARQLQNIASLDATTTATIEAAIQSAPNTFTDLQVTGISTFTNGPVFIGSGTSTGTVSQRLQVTGGAYISGLVGIGTTNPQSTLHLQSAAPTLRFTETDAAANHQQWMMLANNQELYWQAQTDAYSGGGNIFKMTRSNEQIQTFEGLNSGVTWFKVDNNTQRVGVGTTNPGEKLHIGQGRIRLDEGWQLTWLSTAGTQRARIAGDSGSNFILETGASNTEALRVDSLQRVGINTSNPARPLHVNGTVRIADSAALEWGGTSAYIAGTSASNALFFNTSSTERVRIDSSGNVGVGTNNPGQLLDVRNGLLSVSNTQSQILLHAATNTPTVIHRNDGSDYYVLLTNNSASPNTTWNGLRPLSITLSSGRLNSINGQYFDGTTLIGTATSTGTASQPLQVTGSAYISGNLGIGNTNPGAKLDVTGDVRLSAADAEIEFNTGGARLKGRTNALSIHTGGGLDTETSEQVRINTTGVGIGTNNPTVNLQLSPTASISNVGTGITLPGTVGAALTVAQFLHINTNSSYLRIKATRNEVGTTWTTASTKILQVTDLTEQSYIEFNPIGSSSGGAAGLAFGGTTGEWARFNTSGNFGIGTTNPGTKLNVVDNSSSDAVRITQLGAGNALVVEDSTNPDITPFVINAGGAVGIGTTNPTSLLHLGPSNGNTLSHLYLASGNIAFGWRFDTQDFGGGSVPLRIFRRVNGTDTEAITVLNQSGNVGLGSTLPTAALTIGTVGSTTTGASQIYLNGATSNRIDFNSNGIDVPTFTTRSPGTKIVLYPILGGATVDYAIGVESGHIWQSVASTSSAIGFKWYGGTTELAVLKGNGNLGIGTTDPQATLHVEGNAIITGILTATNGLQGEAFESYEIDLIGYTGYNLRTEETQIEFTEDNGTTTDPYLWGTIVTLPVEDSDFTEDNTFIPFFNSEVVSIENPFRLMITVNGVLQSAFINNTDYVYQSNFLGSRNGYTIDSDNNIKFTESIPTGSDIVARVLPVSGTATKIKNYPFKPTDIVLGY